MNTSIKAILACSLLLAVNANAEEVKLPFNGLTLNAQYELVADNGLKDGVVLITHGTLAHNRMEVIETVQGLLAESEVNSLAINLSLGMDDRHGMYDCTVPHQHKHTDALDEINAWIGWLSSQGAEKIVLMGHSRGGNQTAWFMAERDRPELAGAVLLAPGTWNESEAAQSYEQRYEVALSEPLTKAEAMLEAGTGATIMDNTDFIYCEDTQVQAESFVSEYRADERRDTPTLITRITKPVMVIAGSEDKVVKGLIEAVEGLPGGADKMTVIDGADHYFRDLYADEVVEAMVEFLESLND